jgi:hypothetical protein
MLSKIRDNDCRHDVPTLQRHQLYSLSGRCGAMAGFDHDHSSALLLAKTRRPKEASCRKTESEYCLALLCAPCMSESDTKFVSSAKAQELFSVRFYLDAKPTPVSLASRPGAFATKQIKPSKPEHEASSLQRTSWCAWLLLYRSLTIEKPTWTWVPQLRPVAFQPRHVFRQLHSFLVSHLTQIPHRAVGPCQFRWNRVWRCWKGVGFETA